MPVIETLGPRIAYPYPKGYHALGPTKEKALNSKTILWVALAIAAAFFLYLGFRPAGGAGVRNVDAAGAAQAIAAGAQIVDVRTAGEFQMGHIKGAVNVPVDQLSSQIGSWDKNKTYVVYCATGSRSVTAVNTMQQMGFSNIVHLAAGIQAWTEPLETGSGSAAQEKIETSGKPVFIEFYTDS